MILIDISNVITVTNLVFTKEFLKDLNKEFSIPNPKIEVLKRLGKRAYGVPKLIFLYKYLGSNIIFNRGDFKKVITLVNSHRKDDITSTRISTAGITQKFVWNQDFVLRDYQNEALELANKSKFGGMIIVPAGGGKTILGLKIIQELGLKALWITHTKDLLYQSAENCEKTLGFYPGIIGDGKQIIKAVTMATVQTLSRRPNLLKELKKEIGVIIVDEAHHVPTNYFTSVIQEFNSKYIFGLTATPDRKDKLERLMYSVVGEKLIQINRSHLYNTNKLIIPKLVPIYTQFSGDIMQISNESVDLGGDGSGYQNLIDALIIDEERLNLIIETIIKNYKNNRNLVLVEWIKYAEKIIEKLKLRLPAVRIEFIQGSVKKDDRSKLLEDFRQNRLNILFATKLAREGLDLPNMTQLFLTTPKNGDSDNRTADGSALEQEIGRLMRPDPESKNKNATVFDFVDYECGILKNQWYTRRRTYKRLGIACSNKESSGKSYIQELFPDL